MPRVLGHDAGRIAWNRLLHFLETSLDLFGREFEVQLTFGNIEDNHVAGFDRGNWSPSDRFGSDMAGHETMGGPRKSTVGQERDGVPQARSNDRGGNAQHLPHARPA